MAAVRSGGDGSQTRGVDRLIDGILLNFVM